jgi:hypothetical protein
VALGGLSVTPSVAQVAEPPPDSSFQKVTLENSPGGPMDLVVLPDLRVLHTTRNGEVRMHHPKTGLNTVAATLDVQHDEEGLQSIARRQLQGQQVGLPVLPSHRWTLRWTIRPPPGQRGQRARVRHPGRLCTIQGREPAVALQAHGRQAGPGVRAADHRGGGPTATSAAIWVARSTSTRRATCTCRPATTDLPARGVPRVVI